MTPKRTTRKAAPQFLRVSAFAQAVEGKDPKAVYVLCGAEPYLLAQARRTVRDHVLGDADPGMAMVELTGPEADAADVLDLLRTPPLLAAARRLVHVREADPFVSAARGLLERYLEHPAPTGSLALEVAKWNPQTKLAARVAEVGVVVQCEVDRPYQVPAWLQQEARRRSGKTLTSEAAHMLVDDLGLDLAALVSAIDSLALYCGPSKRIDAPDVDALVARGHHERVWDLCNAVAARDLPRALELLDAFWAERKTAPEIVGLIRVQVRQLTMAHALNRRMGIDAAMGAAGVPRFAFARVRQALDGFTGPQLAEAYQAMVDADLEAKTTRNDRLAMEMLIHRLCRPEPSATPA